MNAARASIPEVPGLPIVGNLLEMRRDRVGFMLAGASKWPELVQMRMGLMPYPMVMVSDPGLTGEVLVEKADAFHKAPGLSLFGKPLLGKGLLTSEEDLHRRQRRMMAPSFVQKRIAAFADVMTERGEHAIARMRDRATIDFSEATMRVTLEIVGKTLFDAEVGDQAGEIDEALTDCLEYIIGSVQSVVPMPPFLPTPRNRRYLRAVARLDETIFRIIRERRASGEDKGDLLSMLLAARDEEDPTHRMDDKQIRDELMTIFLAGHETTANALAWTFYLLAQHPHVRSRLHDEVDRVLSGRLPTLADLPKLPYTLQVFKESMRLYPPAYMLGRQALRDIEIGRYTIKKNAIVMVNIIGMHRSARLFAEPERFNPERFTPENEKKLPRHAYMPFGGGSRICIGNHFALMEGHLLVATFARKIVLDLEPGVRVAPEPLVTLRPRGGMPMRVRFRSHDAAHADANVVANLG
jgi:cytochrome P450